MALVSYQAHVQVEYGNSPGLYSYQAHAQVEYGNDPGLNLTQAYAQIEYGETPDGLTVYHISFQVELLGPAGVPFVMPPKTKGYIIT